jgi:hypothetical protein
LLELEYANPKEVTPIPLLGVVSAICAGTGLVIYGVWIVIQDRLSEAVVTAVGITLYALFLSGAATGLVAVLKWNSRTALAWIAFALNTAICLFLFFSYFAL